MHVRHKRIATKQEGAGPRTLPGPALSRLCLHRGRPGLASSIGSVPAPRLGASVGDLMPWPCGTNRPGRNRLRETTGHRLDGCCFSRALRLAKCRMMDKKPSVALIRHKSGQDPASDAAKPIPKPASAAQLCSDDQTHHPAIAHLSHFLATNTADSPKEPRLAPGNANAEAQTGGRRRAHGNAPRSQDANANAPLSPVPLSGSKHPRRTERTRTASACGNANTRQRHAPERPATRNTLRPQRGCTGG